MRTALPWILLALVSAGWIGTALFSGEKTTQTDPVPADVIERESNAAEVTQLRATVAKLRAEVKTLQEQQKSAGPQLSTETADKARAAARDAQRKQREAKRKAREARTKRYRALWSIRKPWYEAVKSLKNAEAREKALREMRAAFDGDDEVRRLAALQLARWLGDVKYDRDDWRAAILPHAKSDDPDVRLAALTALAFVKPDAADSALWKDTVKVADRQSAEEVAYAMVRVAEFEATGEVAEAILHLLRDGTNIDRSSVIRGLQSVKTWDPKVEARLIELVRKFPGELSHYYFHFITPHMKPKSEAVLQLMLDKIEKGQDVGTVARGFRWGLDDRQKERAADALIGFAENADTVHTVSALARALQWIAGARHVPRMEALIAGDDVNVYAKRAVEQAIERARNRRQ